MSVEKRKEILQISHRLTKDALYLYLLGGAGFLLAETVLPGIFSQRINFFFLYAGYSVLLIGVIALGKMCGNIETQSNRKWSVWSTRTQILGIIVCMLFLFPMMRNTPYFLWPFLVVGTSVVCVLLIRHLLQEWDTKL